MARTISAFGTRGIGAAIGGMVVAASSLMAVVQTPQSPQYPPLTGVIAGRVVDGVNGGPVADATLILFATGVESWPRTGLRATSDAAGRFEFAGLPAAEFRLSLQAAGYLSGSYGAVAPGDYSGNQIILRSGEKLSGLATRLWPVARLSGTVTDEHGEPVVGFTVRFLRRHYIGAQPVWMRSGQATTDDRGRFQTTNNLQPGDYLVLLPAEPASRTSSSVIHEGVFYGGGRTASTASIITLAAGEDRGGIDLLTTFTAKPKMFTVAGTIVAPESLPLLGYVGLVRQGVEDPVADIEGFRVLVGKGGAFSFSHVPPGEYRLRFVLVPRRSGGAGASAGMRVHGKPAPVSDLTTWFADMPLSLSRSVSDLVVPLQMGNRIRGRVVFDGRSTLPPADVLNTVLMHVDHVETREMSVSIDGLPTGAVDPQGRFETVGLPPGRYYLDPYAPIDNARHVVTSVQVGGHETVESGLDLGTSDLTDVVVTLSSRTWELTGVVRDQAGRPVPGTRLLVFPRDRSRRHLAGYWVPPRIAHVAADRSGTFRVTGAFSGDHLVVAVTSPPEFWMAPEYLETLVPVATSVTLELGEKRAIELRLQ